MRLSEAILLGSTMNPQAFYIMKTTYGTCAIGAALEANGIDASDALFLSYPPPPSPQTKLWPWAYNDGVSNQECPQCKPFFSTGFAVIAHLNDEHKWTREEIAEWVAKIEPVETLEPVVEIVTEAVCA